MTFRAATTDRFRGQSMGTHRQLLLLTCSSKIIDRVLHGTAHGHGAWFVCRAWRRHLRLLITTSDNAVPCLITGQAQLAISEIYVTRPVICVCISGCLLQMSQAPNHTLYVQNLYEKVKTDGKIYIV